MANQNLEKPVAFFPSNAGEEDPSPSAQITLWLDSDSRILDVNPAGLALTALSGEEICRRFLINELSPTASGLLRAALDQVFDRRLPVYRLDLGEGIRLGAATLWIIDLLPEKCRNKVRAARLVVHPLLPSLSGCSSSVDPVPAGSLPPARLAGHLAEDHAFSPMMVSNEQFPTPAADKAEFEHILERRAAQLAALNQIVREIAAGLETGLDPILQKTVDLLQSHFGFFSVAFYLLDGSGSAAHLRAHAGSDARRLAPAEKLLTSGGALRWVIENKRTLLVDDMNNEIPYLSLITSAVPPRSELTVPVLDRGTLAGLFDLQSPLPHAFDSDDIEIIETVAGQLGVAITNTRLYAQLQERLAEKQKVEDLLRLQRDMLAAVGQTGKFPQALAKIIAILSPLGVFDAGSIYLLEADGGLRAAAHYGISAEFAACVDYLPAEAHKTRFVTLGKPGYLPYATLNFDPRIPAAIRARENLLSIAEIPMLHRQKVIGNLTLASHRTADIPLEARPLLETVTQQLGALIARLKAESELGDQGRG